MSTDEIYDPVVLIDAAGRPVLRAARLVLAGQTFGIPAATGVLFLRDDGQWTSVSGGSAQLSGATFTGWLAPAVSALTFGTAIPVNAALGNVFTLTLTASTGTVSNPTNPVDGQIIRFRVAQDGTGSRTVAWGSAYDFGSGSAPALSTAAGKVDVLPFEYNAALSKWMYLGAVFPQGF